MRAGDLGGRDLAVLGTTAELRVVSTHQLQALHFPASEHGSDLTAARRCRRALERLSTHHLLSRLERRIGGVRAGSASWLYRLGPAGVRALGLPGRAAWREPSRWFVEHLLAIGDVHTQLHRAARAGTLRELVVVHEPNCWRHFPAPQASNLTLKPDLQVDCTTGEDDLRWWVEVDRATESLPTIVKKAGIYEHYWRSGQETLISAVFPRVLWLVPSERRAAAIRQTLAARGDLTPELHQVGLQSQALELLQGHPANDAVTPTDHSGAGS